MIMPPSGGTGTVRADGRSGVRLAAESSTPAPVPSHPTWPRVSTLELKALPTAVACGRLHAKQVLWEWKLDHLADDAVNLVSELLTNAVQASASPSGAGLVALRLLANRQQLIIEVWDQSPDDPKPGRADFEAEHGRGFTVIEAYSNRWGYHRTHANRKVVWCELLVEGR
jgi:anti-sigma regulatory factor (Ser/Thr protein kinase)